LLSLTQILKISLLSGFLGLDATAAVQVMVCRPLVVGGAVGWMLNDPALGLAIGSLVEMLWIGGVPVGALVPPDGTQAAVVAACVAIELGHCSRFSGAGDAAAALGVIAALAVGVLGARAEIFQRRLSGLLVRRAERAVEEGSVADLRGVILGAIGLAWLRGSVVCAVCLAAGLPALGLLLAALPSEAIRALHLSFWLIWLLGLAMVADHFWERRALKQAGLALLVLVLLGTVMQAQQAVLLALAVAGAYLGGLWRWMRARRGEAA